MRSATLSTPDLAADHFQPTPLLETPGHLQASLAQSLWGLLVHTTFCLSPLNVSGGGVGQWWPAAGLGALSVAVHACHHYLHYLHHSLTPGK